MKPPKKNSKVTVRLARAEMFALTGGLSNRLNRLEPSIDARLNALKKEFFEQHGKEVGPLKEAVAMLQSADKANWSRLVSLEAQVGKDDEAIKSLRNVNMSVATANAASANALAGLNKRLEALEKNAFKWKFVAVDYAYPLNPQPDASVSPDKCDEAKRCGWCGCKATLHATAFVPFGKASCSNLKCVMSERMMPIGKWNTRESPLDPAVAVAKSPAESSTNSAWTPCGWCGCAAERRGNCHVSCSNTNCLMSRVAVNPAAWEQRQTVPATQTTPSVSHVRCQNLRDNVQCSLPYGHAGSCGYVGYASAGHVYGIKDTPAPKFTQQQAKDLLMRFRTSSVLSGEHYRMFNEIIARMTTTVEAK